MSFDDIATSPAFSLLMFAAIIGVMCSVAYIVTTDSAQCLADYRHACEMEALAHNTTASYHDACTFNMGCVAVCDYEIEIPSTCLRMADD